MSGGPGSAVQPLGPPAIEAADGRLVVYPRCIVVFNTTMEGATPGTADADLQTTIIPSRASVVMRSHSQAGEATVTVHGSALPFPVQRMAGIFMQVYMGCVPNVDDGVFKREYLRFCGYVDEVRPKQDSKGTEVEVKARDMSAIFRDFHPLPAALMATYEDDLGTAINRIILGTPGALEADGRPRVTIRGLGALDANSFRTTRAALSAAAHGRATQTHIPLPSPTVTAMQAIEHYAGLVSVPYRFDLNELVLRPAAREREENEPVAATLSFGDESGTITDLEFDRKFVRNRRGVRVISYDPITRTRVFADWPADADARLRRPPARVGNAVFARINSHGVHPNGQITANTPNPERDVFPAPQGLYDQATMLQMAKQLWDQRSVQEAEGRLVTPLWTNDVIGLRNASRFRLRVRPQLEAELRQERDDSRAADLLVRRLGCQRKAAESLVRAYRSQADEPLWYCGTVTHEFVSDGVCQSTIEFMNVINVTT